MSEFWELQRMGILRQDESFLVLTPVGGFYEIDQRSADLLLQLHGKSKGMAISGYTSEEVREFSLFAESELLLIAKPLPIESPFSIAQVRRNLADTSLNMLTLGDLALQITNSCNYACYGCSADSQKERAQIVDIDFERAIKDAARFGCFTLGLTGGEPLLPPIVDQICELIRMARSHNFQKVIIATNGYHAKRFIKPLKEAGATRLSISFHGFDGYMESYTGCFEASVRSQEAIQACIGEGLHLGINCVLTQKNLLQMDRLVETFCPMIAEIPHAYLRFSPLVKIGRADRCNQYLLTPNQVAEVLDKVHAYKKLWGCKVRCACNKDYEPGDPLICDAGLLYAMVNICGDISACDLLSACQFLGSVREESFFSIWNDNERWRDYRDIIPLNSRCSSCPVQISRTCYSKCKALAYLRLGSVTMTEIPNERRCLVCSTK